MARNTNKKTTDGAKAVAKAKADATADQQVEGAATAAENAKLEHSVDGSTTRDDLNDAGVPMQAGSPKEPVGPEDALGEGAKRGDYRDRVVGNPHEAVAVEGGGEAIRDEDGNVLDYAPRSALQAQKPRTEEIGDEPGKGGVPVPEAALG